MHRGTVRAICAGTLLWLVGCGGNSDGAMLSSEATPAIPGAGSAAPTQPSGAAQPAAAGAAAATMPMTAAAAGSGQSASQMPAMAQGMQTAQNAQAGQGAQPAQGTAPAQGMQDGQAMQTPAGVPPPEGFKPNAMGECDLHTKWAGDEYCILPPPPDKGFQLHVGPSDYDNPEQDYVLQPGEEWVHRFMATSANDKDIQFYVRQYRMRPGAHHTIVMDTSTGRRLSGSDVNQDHPVGGIIAPENADLGIPLTAHAPLSIDHHAINTTDKPLLQEVWVNFWYVDPSKVKETTTLLYDPGSVSTTVAPHEDVVLGPYSCDINSPGRLINMFGHVHANNVRFSAWRTRNGKRDLIYESYHWEDPLWLEFTSLAKNNPPDPDKKVDGGWTGVLDLQPGDTLDWECHEVNQQDTTLRFVNETYNGWMCIIIGELVGTSCESRSGFKFDPSFMF